MPTKHLSDLKPGDVLIVTEVEARAGMPAPAGTWRITRQRSRDSVSRHPWVSWDAVAVDDPSQPEPAARTARVGGFPSTTCTVR